MANEPVAHAGTQYLKAGEHFAFDLAFRHAKIDARPDEQVRAGLTFDL